MNFRGKFLPYYDGTRKVFIGGLDGGIFFMFLAMSGLWILTGRDVVGENIERKRGGKERTREKSGERRVVRDRGGLLSRRFPRVSDRKPQL